MSAIPVEQIKRNRHETGGLKHIPEVRCFICGGCI